MKNISLDNNIDELINESLDWLKEKVVPIVNDKISSMDEDQFFIMTAHYFEKLPLNELAFTLNMEEEEVVKIKNDGLMDIYNYLQSFEETKHFKLEEMENILNFYAVIVEIEAKKSEEVDDESHKIYELAASDIDSADSFIFDSKDKKISCFIDFSPEGETSIRISTSNLLFENKDIHLEIITNSGNVSTEKVKLNRYPDDSLNKTIQDCKIISKKISSVRFHFINEHNENKYTELTQRVEE